MADLFFKCIYCKEEKPKEAFIGVEHVVQKAFGTFGPNTPTLVNCVCDDCNGAMGREIDIPFARDSVEGHLRFQIGDKAVSEYKSLGRNSLTKRTLDDHPQLRHAHLVLKQQGDDLAVDLAPQVGVRWKDSEDRAWFELHKLPSFESLAGEDLDWSKPDAMLLVGASFEEAEPILRDAGWKFKNRGDIQGDFNDGSPVVSTAVYTMDSTRFRAVAKIAFNYLAYTNGATVTLQADFDPIRRFIRYGEGSYSDFGRSERVPVLHNEKSSERRLLAHIVTLERNARAVVASVSMFNQTHYRVLLAKDPSPALKVYGYGTAFNFKGKNVLPMEARKELSMQ